MRIDSPHLVLLGVIGTLLLAVGWALTWDRWGKIGRAALVTASVLAVASTSLLQVNRLTEAYPSWSALIGRPPHHATPSEPGSDTDADAAPVSKPGAPVRPGQSQMVAYQVAGRASALTLPMYVYLPPGYNTAPGTRFPVIEASHGYPGTNVTWLRKLHVQHYLDAEIAAGRMAPTVVLFPMQTTQALLDTECTDLVHGPKSDTFLTTDVPAFVDAHFHVRTDRAGWGLVGYSAGGFCATNLLLRHPDRFAAAASLSGYSSPGIAIGDGSERTYNNPAWRLQHLPQPSAALWLGWAEDDKVTKRNSLQMAALAHAPLRVSTAVVAHGGHSHTVWEQMEPPAFDWLSAHLARPSITESPGT
jgi:enterochelin esterase-like enzyme